MFPGATWGHISCTAIAPAVRFPRFLSVQIRVDNSTRPWSYLCWRCNENTHCSPVLEIPLSDSVTHSSFPHTSSRFCSLLCFREPLTTNTVGFSYCKLSLSKFLHDQFCSPTGYDQPFSSDPDQCLLLLTCSYFLPYTLFMQSYSQVIPCPILRDQVCTSAAQDVSKVRGIFLNEIQSLCLCRPFPMPEAHPAQALLAWSSLFLSPSDSFRSCQAPALGGLCHSWISFQPPQAGVQVPRRTRVWGHAGCNTVPYPALPSSWGSNQSNCWYVSNFELVWFWVALYETIQYLLMLTV